MGLKGYLTIGTLLAFLALLGGLMVTKSALTKANKEVTRLEMIVASRDKTIDAQRARILATAGVANNQAELAAVVCQGTGADLFERGKQIGLATCAAR